MPEDQETQHWFVLLNGKRYGPYTLPALVKGVEKGVIGQSAGVWRPGWDQWRTAGEVPELFAPEPPPIEAFEEKQEPQEQAEAPATSPDEPEEAQEETREPQEAEAAETAEDRGGLEDAADTDAAYADAAYAGSAHSDSAHIEAVDADSIAATALSTAPEPAVVDPEPVRPEPAEIESPREVRESGRRNRFRDGPDLFGRGFARSDPVRLEPIKSDTAKHDPKFDPKLDPVRPEVGKLDLPKLDLPKLDFGAAPRREGAPRNPGARGLLARAIPSELGAPDIGSRNQPMTDAALRDSLNTMLASADVAPPRKGSAKEPGAPVAPGAEEDGEAAMEQAVEPVRDPAATKPLIAVERLSDVSSAARRRKAEIKPDLAGEREPPNFPAGPPPLAAPEPVPEPEGAHRGGGLMTVILSVFATLLVVCLAAWAASALGLIRVEFLPGSGGRGTVAALQSLPGDSSAVRPHATLDGLPDIVANMPAVIALKMADPDAFGKFLERFTAAYHDNEPDDVILTQARTAVRKSIKHLLANATNESLLEVTEVNLAYMRGLAQSNAGSCVALSDESKGAVLDANLARDFPPLFEREMAVLERVISNAGSKQTAPTEAEVRPYLEAVFADLKKKPVQTQLLGRDKLSEAEYAPYCDLVIAFYEGVRALPFNDAVKLLRNLYAAAATDPDKS
jgi:hypothetical protein